MISVQLEAKKKVGLRKTSKKLVFFIKKSHQNHDFGWKFDFSKIKNECL